MDVVQLIAAVGLLAGNFFFVAVEFSVTKARPTMLEDLVEEGAAGSGSFKHAVDHIDSYLSACQLGITVCSIGLGVTAEPVLTHLVEGALPGSVLGIAAGTAAFAVSYAAVSMLHVVLGELAPKSLAIARWRRVGLVLLPPMRIFYLATKPVVDAFNWLGNAILRPFGIPPASEAEGEPHSETELRTLIAESEERGMLEPEEQAFAVGAFTFGDHCARDVMVAGGDVASIVAQQDPREAVRRAARSGHRRLPLVERDAGLDRPLGFVLLEDLSIAALDGASDGIRDLAHPLLETSEDTLLDDLLDELRDEGEEIALVRDRQGRGVGIVTREDILEQVVGRLGAEHGRPPA